MARNGLGLCNPPQNAVAILTNFPRIMHRVRRLHYDASCFVFAPGLRAANKGRIVGAPLRQCRVHRRPPHDSGGDKFNFSCSTFGAVSASILTVEGGSYLVMP